MTERKGEEGVERQNHRDSETQRKRVPARGVGGGQTVTQRARQRHRERERYKEREREVRDRHV